MTAIDYRRPMADHPLQHGLAAWWIALPQGPYWGGPLMRDIVGSNHGILTNAPTWRGAMARPGGWGCLDGTSAGYVTTAGPTLTTPMTIAFWVWISSAIAHNAHLFGWYVPGSPYTGWGVRRTSPSSLQFWTGASWHDIGTYAAEVWQHWMIASTSSGLTVYRDGVQTVNVAASPVGGYTGTKVILASPAMDFRASAMIDDVRLYSRAITAIEARALYEESRRGYPGMLRRVPEEWVRRAPTPWQPAWACGSNVVSRVGG